MEAQNCLSLIARASFDVNITYKSKKLVTFLLWRPLKSGALGGCLAGLGLEPALIAEVAALRAAHPGS